MPQELRGASSGGDKPSGTGGRGSAGRGGRGRTQQTYRPSIEELQAKAPEQEGGLIY